MKKFVDAKNSGELYIWIDGGGSIKIPGGLKVSREEMEKMIPREVKYIKETYWEFLNTEHINSVVASYKSKCGILFQWDFYVDYIKRFGLDVSEAIKYVYNAAISSEKWQFFGEVFISIGTLPDGGHQIYWFAPINRLPVRRYEYPAPRRVFENSIDLYKDEQFGSLDEWISNYEKETGFHLLES
jgi:hypothetical protein